MRAFLFLFLVSFCSCSLKEVSNDLHFDVVVIGGGASGSMAGIQSARLGSSTLIIEETPWLGGMLSSAGVSAIDGNYKLYSGLWQEFRGNIYNHYGGEDSVKTGWVSNVLFEPDVAADIILKMAKEQKLLDAWFNSSLKTIKFVDKQWKIVLIKEGVEQTISASIVIDGTELGDISKLVGIPYDVGMDSRDVTNEEIAPNEANDIIQDLTYVAILKDYGMDHHLIERPEDYDPSLFQCTCAGICDQDTILRKLWDCAQMMNYGKLPNDKYMINWPIFGNDYYANVIELNPEERKVAYSKAKWFTKCYVYYLQRELGFTSLGIADDVFPTEDGFPFFPYHRESRRIKGIVRFDINDLANPFSQTDALYRTGVAVGDYPVDHHHEAFPDHEQLPDLHFYPVPSYSLPLGTLIPEKVENFIVAEKSISVTNIVNGTTRLQPVCLLIGQTAGVLAHLSAKNEISPREVSVRDVQDMLLLHDAYIMPYSDVSPDDKAFKSIQRIGATGILRGEGINIGWENHTLFHPDSVLTYEAIFVGLKQFDHEFQIITKNHVFSIGEARDILISLAQFLDLHYSNLNAEIEKTWGDYQFGDLNHEKEITRRQFAVLLDKIVDPFHYKQVDHFGNFLD